MKSSSPIFYAATLIQVAAAARWIEPSATPIGEWAGGMGFSPIPTEAPGPAIRGISIPKELRKRQTFSDNWCGYVNGDVEDVLSCGVLYTCLRSSTAVGCCGSEPIAACTGLYTSCVGFDDNCGSACSANKKILKCSSISLAYCATYTFASGLVNYNCDALSGVISSVAFLSDIGSGTAPVPSLTFPTSRFSVSTSSFTSTRSSFTSTSSSDSSPGFQFTAPPKRPSRKKSIGSGAIAGVVVGAIAIIGMIAGLAAFFLLRKKPAAPIPPMQQQQQYQNPPVNGAYPPPQQQQYAPPQQGPYFPGAQPVPGAATSFYDAKSPQPNDVPPQYQPNTHSPQPPQQEYVPFNPAAAAGAPQPRDSMAKPAQLVPEISGTEVAGGPSRVTSPVSAVGTGHVGNQQGYEVGSTSGPVYEMPEGMHR
ncbi:MAG: hypothetical protein M1840_008730 [Geoglossum simile]|nr:MAG: hypothetical protein M1840_008730 [Geoglossum simile]